MVGKLWLPRKMSDIEDECGCSGRRSSRKRCDRGCRTRAPIDVRALSQVFTFDLPNLRFDGNQQGVEMMVHRFAGGIAAQLQIRPFSGVFTNDVEELVWDDIPFAPCNPVTILVHMNNNGLPIVGLFKLGGRNSNARMYISAKYGTANTSVRRGSNRWRDRRCDVMFRAGDNLVCQGFSLNWFPNWDRS